MNNAYRQNAIVVGPVPLPNRVLLAPMSGVTDAPFRRMASDLGAGLVISEMTACAALAEGKRIARGRAKGHGSGPHVVQLAGCEARWMAEGARIAEGLGADIIDINMGCPAKHVTNGASGSALMRDLDHALTLIEAVVGAVRVPVTLKMRLGWDDRTHNAAELARRAQGAGVRLATVHGRSLPVLQRPRRLDGGAQGQRRRIDSGRGQRRYRKLRRCGRGARRIPRGRGDGRARRARAAVVSGSARALSRRRPARRSAAACRAACACERALR
jgi:hypothetical protein